MEEYVRLRKIHEFLIAACDNKEILYYVDLTN